MHEHELEKINSKEQSVLESAAQQLAIMLVALIEERENVAPKHPQNKENI